MVFFISSSFRFHFGIHSFRLGKSAYLHSVLTARKVYFEITGKLDLTKLT